MTEHDKLVEDCARAIYETRPKGALWNNAQGWVKDGFRSEARAALAIAVERCAWIAQNACLVPPDGGSPSQAECDVCDEAALRIRALLSPNDRGEA